MRNAFHRWFAGCLLAGTCLTLAVPAQASFPGQNGKFAYRDITSANEGIYAVNPDGSGRIQLAAGSAHHPAWSPDGTKVAFARFAPSQYDLWIVNADGSNPHPLTSTASSEYSPAWSPDGTKIVFQNYNVLETINADGTGRTTLFTGSSNFFAREPEWSPDGSKIAFRGGRANAEWEIYTINPDGTGLTNITNTPDADTKETAFDWSPDGSKIVFDSYVGDFVSSDIYTMNPDGSGRTNITNSATTEIWPRWSPDGEIIVFFSYDVSGQVSIKPDGSERDYFSGEKVDDWQPVSGAAQAGYPRPRGATPLHVSLVPAFRKCNGPDRQHGAPLAFPSCSVPTLLSEYLTVGTPDANGRGAKAVGSVRLSVILGNEATSADEADVRLKTQISDVRDKVRLSDYLAELHTAVTVRLTDRAPFQTVSDFEFAWSIPCADTADATVGSSCESVTTADAVVPGSVPEGSRSIWQVGQVQVSDGGEDGVGSTTADNTLFLKQGIFVP